MTASAHNRVLIAEDDPICSVIVQRILEKGGYDVVVVKNGKAALHAIETAEFYAVVADWMLPELDGIEVIRFLTERPGNKTKAFLTSVIDIPAAREHAVAAGAQDFLPKPMSPATLLKALRTEVKSVATKNAVTSHPMLRTATWPNLPLLMSAPMSELLNREIIVELAAGIPDAPLALTCGLIDPGNGSELTPWIIARESAAISIAAAMLGEAPSGLVEATDAVGEVLNLIASIAKTEFATNDINFTQVLPKQTTSKEIRKMTDDSFGSIVTTIALGEATFVLGYSARAANAVEMRVEDLREGFVLAEDLRNASGSLVLLPACTRLTATAAQRVRESCKGRKVRVHVPLASVA